MYNYINGLTDTSRTLCLLSLIHLRTCGGIGPKTVRALMLQGSQSSGGGYWMSWRMLCYMDFYCATRMH